jgi:capsule polysaccharide modification protein KpsS
MLNNALPLPSQCVFEQSVHYKQRFESLRTLHTMSVIPDFCLHAKAGIKLVVSVIIVGFPILIQEISHAVENFLRLGRKRRFGVHDFVFQCPVDLFSSH